MILIILFSILCIIGIGVMVGVMHYIIQLDAEEDEPPEWADEDKWKEGRL